MDEDLHWIAIMSTIHCCFWVTSEQNDLEFTYLSNHLHYHYKFCLPQGKNIKPPSPQGKFTHWAINQYLTPDESSSLDECGEYKLGFDEQVDIHPTCLFNIGEKTSRFRCWSILSKSLVQGVESMQLLDKVKAHSFCSWKDAWIPHCFYGIYRSTWGYSTAPLALVAIGNWASC